VPYTGFMYNIIVMY